MIKKTPLLALAVLSGCATMAQKTARSDHDALVAAKAAMTACIAPINSDPQYAPLTAYMSFAGSPTIEQMTNTTFATPEQVKLVESRLDRLTSCDQAYINAVSSVSPDLGQPYADWLQAETQLAVNLVQQRITWGQFDTERDKIGTQGVQQAQQVYGELQGELAQENEEEQEARARALANVSAALAASQPHTTHCTSFGATTNCTSY